MVHILRIHHRIEACFFLEGLYALTESVQLWRDTFAERLSQPKKTLAGQNQQDAEVNGDAGEGAQDEVDVARHTESASGHKTSRDQARRHRRPLDSEADPRGDPQVLQNQRKIGDYQRETDSHGAPPCAKRQTEYGENDEASCQSLLSLAHPIHGHEEPVSQESVQNR